jgi:hypothetical protein
MSFFKQRFAGTDPPSSPDIRRTPAAARQADLLCLADIEPAP